MTRPNDNKNVMRTPEEKEKIVLEYLNGNVGQGIIGNKYNISKSLICYWTRKYQKDGIIGLKSQTGKKIGIGRPKNVLNEEERLKREIAKLEIEVARLKKGYQVKGVGAGKEYVTIFDVNMK